MSINVYTNNGMTMEEIERYWLDLLKLPSTSVPQAHAEPRPTSGGGRARNKLPYGVVTPRRAQHLDGSAHLWSHSGVRGVRRAGSAGLSRVLDGMPVRRRLSGPP